LKNIEVVIRAFDIIINKLQRENIYFYVAGDGPERQKLETLIGELGLFDNIFLLGYRSDIGALLNSCDIFVHPAYDEGFGIAVAEAMLACRPIIVSNAGALPELIIHNESGLVVNPFDPQEWANAIIQLIDNKEFAKYLAVNANQRAKQNFTEEKFVLKSELFYKEVLFR